jgi:hypothetical protein
MARGIARCAAGPCLPCRRLQCPAVHRPGNKAIVTNEYYDDRCIARSDVLVFNYAAGGNETQEIVNSDGQVRSVALSRK